MYHVIDSRFIDISLDGKALKKGTTADMMDIINSLKGKIIHVEYLSKHEVEIIFETVDEGR